jgi:hypothetical protein
MSEYTFFTSLFFETRRERPHDRSLVLDRQETDLLVLHEDSLAEGELAFDLADAVVDVAAEEFSEGRALLGRRGDVERNGEAPAAGRGFPENHFSLSPTVIPT